MVKRFRAISALVLSVALFMGQLALPVAFPIALITVVVTQTACPLKGGLLTWSRRALTGLEKARPILEGAGINLGSVDEAIGIGKQLIAAFEANNNESAIGLMSSLITAFEGIARDTERITNPVTRTLALAVLALTDLALHEISDALAKEEPKLSAGMRGAPAVTKIRQFSAKKRWRCRNSASGRFEKMSECKANPSGTQVETYR